MPEKRDADRQPADEGCSRCNIQPDIAAWYGTKAAGFKRDFQRPIEEKMHPCSAIDARGFHAIAFVRCGFGRIIDADFLARCRRFSETEAGGIDRFAQNRPSRLGPVKISGNCIFAVIGMPENPEQIRISSAVRTPPGNHNAMANTDKRFKAFFRYRHDHEVV